MNNRDRLFILKIFKKMFLNFKSGLKYNNNFEFLISVILSSRSTDKTVNNVTKKLYKKANTPRKMYFLGLEKIKKYIYSIGFFNRKSKYIFDTCKILIDKYNGIVPGTRQELQKLPGVGRKVSNVILNKIFKKNTIAVDTHVFRVSNRTKFASGKTVLQVEKKLMKVVPIYFYAYISDWFIFHGRNTCKSIKPKCNICLIKKFCDYVF